MRILVVEDDPATARLICEALGRVGHDPVAYSSGIGALAAANRERFDLLVSDLMLPDFNGIDTIGQVRQRYPQMPVIVVSALERAEWEVKCQAAGAACYIQKPLRLQDLIDEVTLVEAARINLNIGVVDALVGRRDGVARALRDMGCRVDMMDPQATLAAPPADLTLLLLDGTAANAVSILRWAASHKLAAVAYGEAKSLDDDALMRAGASFCTALPLDAHAVVLQARFLVGGPNLTR